VLARRLLLLAAVLMLLAVIAAGLAPQDPAEDAPSLQASDLPAGGDVDEQLSADGSDSRRVVVNRGDVLTLDISGTTPDSVLIERLDRIESIDPSTPAHFELLADAPAGVYPIRLIDADRRIGAIEIRD
jgi:hypothetical protein